MTSHISPFTRRKRRGALAAAAALLLLAAPSAIAGARAVDNSMLNLPAPDWYACAADGANTICRGAISTSLPVNEPTGCRRSAWPCRRRRLPPAPARRSAERLAVPATATAGRGSG